MGGIGKDILIPLPGFGEKVAARGLDAHQFRHAVDPAQGEQVFKPLVQAADDAAIADADEDAVGRLPAELFADLKAGSLLPFAHVGVVAGVAIVPAIELHSLLTEVEGVIVASIDQQYGGAEGKQLGDLGLGRRYGHNHTGRRECPRRHGQGRRTTLCLAGTPCRR